MGRGKEKGRESTGEQRRKGGSDGRGKEKQEKGEKENKSEIVLLLVLGSPRVALKQG